ncbi:hypothetical protein U9M48_000672 [Paspalum notatum var. saurae]|uniref:Uncharacterized protein n=1 Tax=Paspalum notatum var. saurae TaxID=547442 RepID=A0AAQ3PKK2_PASNO
MARDWMYNLPRMGRPYHEEVDKFIEAAKKDAMKKKASDVFIGVDVDDNNDTFFDADFDMLDCAGDDEEDYGGGTSFSLPSEDLGLDADSDADDLEEMLKHFKADILLSGAKGVENFKEVKDAAKKSVYGKSKGCPTHWSLLRFVLELLILKAKYGWSDSSFNDLLKLLS